MFLHMSRKRIGIQKYTIHIGYIYTDTITKIFMKKNERRTIYADNQIGYRAKNIGLKYFYFNNDYDIFAYRQDGVYEITREQYIDFNRGKLVSMSFKKKDGSII